MWLSTFRSKTRQWKFIWLQGKTFKSQVIQWNFSSFKTQTLSKLQKNHYGFFM